MTMPICKRTSYNSLHSLKISFFLIFSLLLQSAIASEINKRFGKISDQTMDAQYCPIDSSAEAYYVFDEGETYFLFVDRKFNTAEPSSEFKGFEMNYIRHFRIKILSEKGLDYANIEIPTHSNSDRESVSDIKAFSYNLVDGEIEKTKLDKNDIHVEKTNKYTSTTKFSIPNVKVGSVIEVEYKITSSLYYNLQHWNFQYKIPVLESKYTTKIPEYYIYNVDEKGYVPIERSTSNERKVEIIEIYTPAEGISPASSYNYEMEYSINITNYTAKNVPALKSIAYLKTYNNYRSRIKFEIFRTQLPNLPLANYSTTWLNVRKKITPYLNIEELSKRSFLSILESIEHIDSLSASERLVVAHKAISEKVKWNGYQSIYPRQKLDEAFDNGSGNCAEINLMLVSLLNDLKVECFPMVLSTRDNGLIPMTSASINAFNYVIACAKIERNYYLLDATDRYSGVNMLPHRCQNSQGLIIDRSLEPQWINLENIAAYHSRKNITYELKADNSISGKGMLQFLEYASYIENRSYENTKEKIDYFKKFKKEDVSIQYSENNFDKNAETNRAIASIAYTGSVGNTNAGLLYFSPILFPHFKTNPFKEEERLYPVEFDYPMTIQDQYTIKLPDGYKIKELPDPALVGLQDKSCLFKLQMIPSGNFLKVIYQFNLKQELISPKDYSYLKQLFQMMIDKQNEYVVLEKI